MTLAIQSTSETVKEEIEIAEAKMTTDEPLNVVVIAGSVRSGRHGIKLAKFIVSEVERRGHNVTLVDPLDYKEYGLFEKRWLDYENDDENDAPEWLVGLQKIFDEADAYIPISPEYNHGLSPALINIMNLFIKEYKHKTSAIATYSGGSFAGLRAGNAMKAYMNALGCVPTSKQFVIPQIWKNFPNDDGTPDDAAYYRRCQEFLEEMEWWAEAAKVQRSKRD